MSLRDRSKRPKSHCATCGDVRVLTGAGEAFSSASRCPRCFESCENCEGAGVVFGASEAHAPRSWPCPQCQPIDARIRLYNAARVPRRFARADVENFEELSESAKAAKARLLRYHGHFEPGDRGVGISGPVGTGKTHLLAGLVRMLCLERGIGARFVEFTHLLTDIKAGYDAGRSEGQIIGRLAAVPVLVIDELGKGLSTDWQMAILDELVSRRYDRDVTTFFATNFDFEAPRPGTAQGRDTFARTNLEEQIGSRMFSRLCGMCDFLRIDGDDYRRRAEPRR